jgi:hypothetical protein
MIFLPFFVKLFFMHNCCLSFFKIALINKNLALLSLLLCFMFLLNVSGCEEKKEIIIREVKGESAKKAEPAAIAFELSKVVPKRDGGHLDIIDPIKAAVGSDIHIGGWAADLKKKIPATAVIAVVDGRQAQVSIRMGIERIDVAKAFNNRSLLRSGWDGGFNANILEKGKHKLEFYAVLDNGQFVLIKHKDKSFVEMLITD